MSEYQKIADEFCEKRGLPQVSVAMNGSLSSFALARYDRFSKTIELGPRSSGKNLLHELRHHYLDEKTRGLSGIFGNQLTYIASGIGMVAGAAVQNPIVYSVSGAAWMLHHSVEAYADFHNDTSDFLANLFYSSIPILGEIVLKLFG